MSFFAHERIPEKVIVDTDMGVDDVSSVLLFSKMQSVYVKAFVTSDGIQSPTKGSQNLKRLLKYVESNKPVFIGRDIKDAQEPKMRKFVYSLDWKKLPEVPVNYKYLKGVIDMIKSSKDKFSYVCLGPATNLALLLEEIPDLKDRLEAVYFSGNIPETGNEHLWNYERDPEAMDKVLDYDFPVYTFGLNKEQLPIFSQKNWNKISDLKNIHGKALKMIYSKKELLRHLFVKNNVTKIFDDAIPVYFSEPQIADFEEKDDHLFAITKWDKEYAQEVYFRKLKSPYEPGLFPREPVILREYPKNAVSFQPDLRPYVNKIIEVHGVEEWKSAVLANEIHRHLGTYSIIGVKMGIRAREILKAKPDELLVKTMIGFDPPLSCMNDGIQIATGATLGRGTIQVEEKAKPVVEFYTNNRRLTLTLKDDVYNKIQKQISDAIEKHGRNTRNYFEQVRENSIRNWLDLNRKEIFEEKVDQIEQMPN